LKYDGDEKMLTQNQLDRIAKQAFDEATRILDERKKREDQAEVLDENRRENKQEEAAARAESLRRDMGETDKN
jgi:hypothetical protein